MTTGIVRELLEKELSRRGIEYFVSGSSRFGYDNDKSDLDLIVLDESSDAYTVKGLMEDFDGSWKLIRGGSGSRRYISNLAEVSLFGGKVHIVIFTEREGFLDLRKEHEEVQSFLRENPNLTKFIKELKSTLWNVGGDLNGTFIYNTIKKVMATSKSQEKTSATSSQRFLRILRIDR